MSKKILLLVFLLLIVVGCNKKEEIVDDNTTDEIIEDISDDEQLLTYDELNNIKHAFVEEYNFGSYTIYNDKCETTNSGLDVCKDRYSDSLYLLKSSTKDTYFAYAESNDDEKKKSVVNNYVYYNGKERGLINTKYNNIITGYDEYSCIFHSDESFKTCVKSETTIVGKNTKGNTLFGLISLKDKYLILNVEYNFISEDTYGNFLVQKNDKMGLYSSSGKELLPLEYDFIGQNDVIGYIAIKDSVIELYNKKIVKQKLKDTTLNDLFEKASKKSDYDFVYLTNPDSYFWSSGSHFIKQDVKTPYELDPENENVYRFKYVGGKYSGTQLMIFNVYSGCYGNPYLYIINGTIADKASGSELNIPKFNEDETINICF